MEALPIPFAALGGLILSQEMHFVPKNAVPLSGLFCAGKGVQTIREAGLKLSKGDWVLHPRMSGWGYGKVLVVMGERKGRVLFLLAGEKTLSREHAGLNLVEGDRVSQAAFNDQLAEFKLNLARDLLSSEDLRRGMTCSPCEWLTSKRELCKSGPDNLRIYSLTRKGKMLRAHYRSAGRDHIRAAPQTGEDWRTMCSPAGRWRASAAR